MPNKTLYFEILIMPPSHTLISKVYGKFKNFSKPPTINLFKYNSGKFLKKKFESNALCFVIKGLAEAPP